MTNWQEVTDERERERERDMERDACLLPKNHLPQTKSYDENPPSSKTPTKDAARFAEQIQ
jgi:hypothetical protein